MSVFTVIPGTSRIDLYPITRGDDATRSFLWQDDDGAVIATTGRTYTAQIRTHPDATTSYAFTVVVTGASGRVDLSMAKEITATIPPGRQYWDLQQVRSGRTTTVLSGRVTVWPDVTR